MITFSKFSQKPSHVIGFVQAVGVTMYISLFVLLISNMEHAAPDAPEITIGIFMLLAFVVSALSCGSLVLGYPAVLALQGKTKRAIEIVFWSGASMMLFLLTAGLILFAFSL